MTERESGTELYETTAFIDSGEAQAVTPPYVYDSKQWSHDVAEMLLMGPQEGLNSTVTSDRVGAAVAQAMIWKRLSSYESADLEVNRSVHSHYNDSLAKLGHIILMNAVDNGLTEISLAEIIKP